MALKNLFDMVKADRYTQDGREAIIKAQEAETEDATRRTYQIGEISQSTGLQKTANGWVKPKNGKQPGAKKQEKKGAGIPQATTETFVGKTYKDFVESATPSGYKPTKNTDNPDGSSTTVFEKEGKQIKVEFDKNGKITKVSPGEEPGPDRDDSPEREAYERELSRQQAQRAADDPRGFGYEEPPMEPAAGSKLAAENKTTIRQGPNTKTLNETPAEHVQKNLDAYTGYSPYDMEELVLKPSGYEKSRSTKGPDGVSSITYKKDGGDDILLFFDKYGELKNAGTSQNREGVMQKMRAAEGYGHMKVVGDYDVYRVTSGPDKGKYKISKVGSLREVTMSEEKAADFLTSAAGKNKAANKDAAPRVLTGDCRIRIRKEKPVLTGDTRIKVRK